MAYRVLMVCTGNICRSVMAQVVLADRVAQLGLDVEVDSAGISSEESGNPIDPRAASVLAAAGYDVPRHRARQLVAQDLADFDLILAMTSGHNKGVQGLARRSGLADVPADLRMYRSFDPSIELGVAKRSDLDVPDPWYGDLADFRETLATIEAVTPALAGYLAEQLT